MCYVAHLYSTAYDAYPAFDLFPIDYGYKLSEKREFLEMYKFDRNLTPDSIENVKIGEDQGNNSDEDDVEAYDSDSQDEECNVEFDDAQT